MKFSIVVPAFNEEKILARSLQAIFQAAEAFAPQPYEVIVCDNNSTDRTASIAQDLGAKVVFEPINQIARARNRGASTAAGEWIIFVDADSFPSPALFAKVALRMSDPKCAGGGCLIRFDENNAMSIILVNLWNLLSRTQRWAAGSFIFCRTSLFKEIGGFSADLYASEEIDLCRRLKRAARKHSQKLCIISEERLLTSARKLRLYTQREYAVFMIKTLLSPKKVLRNRDECSLWYNGRR